MTTHKIDPEMVAKVLGIEESAILSVGETIYYKDMQKIDIHRFKDMAIAKCAEWGYMIDRAHIECHMWQISIWDNKEATNIYKKPTPIDDMFSAELAAISFVWEQIQKEKKDEH